MNKYAALLCFSLLCFAACKQKPDDVIASANKKVAAINKKLPDYKQKVVDDITSPTKGNITGYYRDDEVKKVYAEHFSDTDRIFASYYFDDGMLIYAEEQDYKYNCSNKITPEIAAANHDSVYYDDKKTRLLVSRYYFDKNKLIKWEPPVVNGKPAPTGDLIAKESLLWAQTLVLLKQLKDE